jgi:glycoprotein-N-acetylgalactosamine 3-beta-galactosyltransferase
VDKVKLLKKFENILYNLNILNVFIYNIIGLYLGRKFQPPNQLIFNSGGAGYLLNRPALQLLHDNIDTPKCYPHQKGFWEDVNIANCLEKSNHITPYDTRDPLERERFHPFNPGLHLTYRIPPKNPDWYPKYNPNLKIGYDCCSSESISFHYVPAQLLYTLHNYLYHCQEKVIKD